MIINAHIVQSLVLFQTDVPLLSVEKREYERETEKIFLYNEKFYFEQTA